MAITDLLPWKREKKVPVKKEAESNPITTLQDNVNRLFDDFFDRSFGMAPFDWSTDLWEGFTPRVDVSESAKDITVSAELPGLDEDDIEVTLSDNALTIQGEKKAETEDKGKNYYRLERSYGTFRRQIPLPCEILTDEADASFKKGLLTVTLPKAVEDQACKRVRIKST